MPHPSSISGLDYTPIRRRLDCRLLGFEKVRPIQCGDLAVGVEHGVGRVDFGARVGVCKECETLAREDIEHAGPTPIGTQCVYVNVRLGRDGLSADGFGEHASLVVDDLESAVYRMAGKIYVLNAGGICGYHVHMILCCARHLRSVFWGEGWARNFRR